MEIGGKLTKKIPGGEESIQRREIGTLKNNQNALCTCMKSSNLNVKMSSSKSINGQNVRCNILHFYGLTLEMELRNNKWDFKNI